MYARVAVGSLRAIDAGMQRMQSAIGEDIRGAQLNASQPKAEDCTIKLILRADVSAAGTTPRLQ